MTVKSLPKAPKNKFLAVVVVTVFVIGAAKI
jgi:hypothetical protein